MSDARGKIRKRLLHIRACKYARKICARYTGEFDYHLDWDRNQMLTKPVQIVSYMTDDEFYKLYEIHGSIRELVTSIIMNLCAYSIVGDYVYNYDNRVSRLYYLKIYKYITEFGIDSLREKIWPFYALRIYEYLNEYRHKRRMDSPEVYALELKLIKDFKSILTKWKPS